MVHGFFGQVANVAVTAQADTYSVGLRQARLTAGVRAVAIRAISHCAGMLHFRRLDELGLVVMAGYAQRFGVGLS